MQSANQSVRNRVGALAPSSTVIIHGATQVGNAALLFNSIWVLVHFGERMSFVSCSSFGIAFATSALLTKGTSCGSIIRQQLASKYRIFSRNLHIINPVLMHRTVCILYTCVFTTRIHKCRFLPTLHSASMCFKGWCCASEQVNWRQRLSLQWTNRDKLGFCDQQPAYKCIICVHCAVVLGCVKVGPYHTSTSLVQMHALLY